MSWITVSSIVVFKYWYLSRHHRNKLSGSFLISTKAAETTIPPPVLYPNQGLPYFDQCLTKSMFCPIFGHVMTVFWLWPINDQASNAIFHLAKSNVWPYFVHFYNTSLKDKFRANFGLKNFPVYHLDTLLLVKRRTFSGFGRLLVTYWTYIGHLPHHLPNQYQLEPGCLHNVKLPLSWSK